MHCTLCSKDVSSLRHHLPLCAVLRAKPSCPRMLSLVQRRLTFQFWPGNFSEEFVIAGLYFTNFDDVLACCWCNHQMGNWDSDDDPLERHLNENPNCMFIFNLCINISSCPHCKKMVPVTKQIPGSRIKPHRERCLKTAIATLNAPGTYPRNVGMVNAVRRWKSFQKWSDKGTLVQELVKNGFYSTAQGNAVSCFYCHATLEDGLAFNPQSDIHIPDCLFAHHGSPCKQQNGDMTHESNRLETFRDWTGPIDPKELAHWGFFYSRPDDLIECAFCKVLIPHQEFQDPPLRVHIRKNPMCPLLRGVPLILKPLYPSMCYPTDRLHTFEKNLQQQCVDWVKNGFYAKGQGVKCFWCGLEMALPIPNLCQTHVEKRPECMFAQNISFLEMNQEKWNRDVLLCIICCNQEREVIFQKCGHWMCCKSCAGRLDKCPVCRRPVSGISRIYTS